MELCLFACRGLCVRALGRGQAVRGADREAVEGQRVSVGPVQY